MRRVVGILVLAGIALLFAMATGFSLLTRLVYVLVLSMAGSLLWAWLSLRWLDVRVERRTSRVYVGQPVDERITVRNTARLPKPWLEVMELTDIPGHQSGMTVSLPAGGFRTWRVMTPSRRRGLYRLGPLRVATGDPFGLFRMERLYAGSQDVLVLPAVVAVPRFEIPSAGLPGDGPTRRRSSDVTPHASTVRDYVPGDSVGRIHWPTSARTGKLAVKEFDRGLTSDVWILLDLDGSVQTKDPDQEADTEETGVTVAASLARHFLASGLPVGLAVNSEGQTSMLPPDRGYLQDARIMDLLAQVKQGGGTTLAQAVAGLDLWLGRQSAMVVVTPSPSPKWVEALQPLGHRNVPVAAVLVDGATFGGDASPRSLLSALAQLGIRSYVVGKDDNMSQALAHPIAQGSTAHYPSGYAATVLQESRP